MILIQEIKVNLRQNRFDFRENSCCVNHNVNNENATYRFIAVTALINIREQKQQFACLILKGKRINILLQSFRKNKLCIINMDISLFSKKKIDVCSYHAAMPDFEKLLSIKASCLKLNSLASILLFVSVCKLFFGRKFERKKIVFLFPSNCHTTFSSVNWKLKVSVVKCRTNLANGKKCQAKLWNPMTDQRYMENCDTTLKYLYNRLTFKVFVLPFQVYIETIHRFSITTTFLAGKFATVTPWREKWISAGPN